MYIIVSMINESMFYLFFINYISVVYMYICIYLLREGIYSRQRSVHCTGLAQKGGNHQVNQCTFSATRTRAYMQFFSLLFIPPSKYIVNLPTWCPVLSSALGRTTTDWDLILPLIITLLSIKHNRGREGGTTIYRTFHSWLDPHRLII